jgi:hypothetical protein
MVRWCPFRIGGPLLFAFAIASLPAAGVFAQERSDADVAEIRDLVKKGELAKALPSVRAIGERDDPKVRELLRDLTSSKDDPIACAAYAAIAKQKDKSFLATMRQRAEDWDLASERRAVYQALLDAFVEFGDESKATHEVLERVVQKHLPLEAEFAIRAIRAYCAVRNKDTVDKLIGWLAEAESTIGPLGNRVAPVSAETRAAHDKEHPAIRECLTSLTGFSFDDAKSWKAWWKERKAGYKCPPPPPKK